MNATSSKLSPEKNSLAMDKVKATPYVYPFWVEYKIDPQRYDYNITFDQEIIGNLCIAKLGTAFELLIRDHPLLNSHLGYLNDALYWIQNIESASLEIIDSELQIEDFCKKPFNIEQSHLYRFGIVCLSTTKYRLVLVFHHALLDGCYHELLQKISMYYNGEECLNTFSYVEYKGFVKQCEVQNSQLINEYKSQDFWEEIFSDFSPNYKFPRNILSQNRPSISEIEFHIKKDDDYYVNKKMYPYSFGYFLMCFSIAVKRFCEPNKHVAITFPVSVKGGEPLGYLSNVNSIVYPIKVREASTYLEQYTSIVKFMKNLKLEGNLRHSDLLSSNVMRSLNIKEIDVGFTCVSLKKMPLNLSDCISIPISQHNLGLAGSKILLKYEDTVDSFGFSLLYRSDLFSESLMNSLLETFRYAMHIATKSSSNHIYDFPYYANMKYNHDVGEKRNNKIISKSIFELLNDSFNKHKENCAVIDGDNSITYKELDEKSNIVAGNLLELLKENADSSTVAILMEKSIDAMVAICAAIKIGSTYLPIDNTYPCKRIMHILKDSKASVAIVDADSTIFLGTIRKNLNNIAMVTLSDALQHHEQKKMIMPKPNPRNIAYIIYTSGSTGHPKGVKIKHESILNFVLHQMDFLNIERDECIALFHSLAFDASIEQYLLAFLTGARLLIVRKEMLLDEIDLIRYMNCNGVTHVDMTPSFLEAYNISKIDSLKRVITGGEPCNAYVLEKYSGIKLINEYGPTETTIVSLQHIYSMEDGIGKENYIGKPISNTHVYIVDENCNRVPEGVIGELCISGICVAEGYVNSSHEACRNFVRNPFNVNPLNSYFKKMYKTGDLAVLHACGNIEYIGRKDHQININGYRVELYEIEKTARSIKQISCARVIAETTGRTKRIVLYYTTSEDLHEQQLIFELKKLLPVYMVPKKCIQLNTMPTTENFKTVNTIEKKIINQEYEQKEPTLTNNQSRGLQALKILIDNEKISLQDELSCIGLDSIISVKLASFFYEKKINCTLREILSCATVNDLMLTIEKNHDFSVNNIIDIKGDGFAIYNPRDDICEYNIFMFPPGNGGIESYANDIFTVFNENARIILFENIYLGNEKKYLSYEDIAKIYIKKIQIIDDKRPIMLFGWCFGGVVAFEVMRQLLLKHKNVVRLVMIDSYFNYKGYCNILNKERQAFSDFCKLNYNYHPNKLPPTLNTKIYLLKAMIPENRCTLSKQMPGYPPDMLEWFGDVNKYYTLHTQCNGLSYLLDDTQFDVIRMHSTHSSWLQDKSCIWDIGEIVNARETV